MPTYAVTGATGQLGRLVVDGLLEQGVAAADVVAIVRNADKAAALIERGVTVRIADYDAPQTLLGALAGVNTLLLISGSDVGRRTTQHSNVIEAAKAAGVARVIYTSVLRADTTELILAPDHKATEAVLKASGLTYSILRNGWYTENYTDHLADFVARGAIVSATQGGRVAAAPRSDYAAAAVVVLTGTGHENATYELAGAPFTMKELAAEISEITGRDIAHNDVTAPELLDILTGSGLDEGTAAFLAALDEATARGDLDTTSDDLARLIGRPTTPLVEAIRTAADSRL